MDGGSIGPDSSNPVEKIRVSTPVNSGDSGAATSTAATDSVHITESARTMASLAEAVSSTPDVDMNRVAAVQHALSAGTYRLSPEGIADKMLQLEQDLGQAKPQ
jgi:negative regulator of flagellin synthesis FlgM